MSRRRSPTPVLSLLAFQDIIVSVTGIVLLITLLLALELTQQVDASDAVDAQLATELQEAIDRLDRERQSLRSAIDAGAERLREESSRPPRDWDREIAQAQLDLDRIRRATEQRAQALARAEDELQHTEAALFDQDETLQELAALEEQIAQLEREAERVGRMVGRLSDRVGWRVELTGTTIRVVPMKQQATSPTYPERTNPLLEPEQDSVTRAFLDWVSSAPIRRSYLLLVVRPSGIARFSGLQKRLDQLGVRYGYEAIGEEDILPDPDEE